MSLANARARAGMGTRTYTVVRVVAGVRAGVGIKTGARAGVGANIEVGTGMGVQERIKIDK